MKPLDLRSLPVQLILGSIGLVVLTAVAAGVPAIWLLYNQLEHQAWDQVEQGRRATTALYDTRQRELVSLATLTAQRPTLRELLDQADPTALKTYLQTLREGADLDLIAVCAGQQTVIAQTNGSISMEACVDDFPEGVYLDSTEQPSQLWLLASHPIFDPPIERLEAVTVGLLLDDDFAATLRDQTGLEHTLLAGGWPTATSLAGGPRARRDARISPVGDNAGRRLFINNQPYYAAEIALTDPSSDVSLQAEVALPVEEIVITQRQLAWVLGGSILVVALVGSVLGVLLARHISRPLARLTRAATTFSRGDLSRPVDVDTWVREVALVGSALETARIDLNLTLNDLQREKAWTDHLLAAIVEGIVTLDRRGKIMFFSSGAERITGWNHDEAVGRSCDDIFSSEEPNPFSSLINPPGRRHKITVTLRDQRQAVLAVTSATVQPPEGSEARLVLVFRDVSEAEAVHRLMGHFLANIAHEFRTPLTSLAASTELLLDQAPDLSREELQELIGSLHLGVLGLQTLIDNLLEGASIEAGRFRVYTRPVELKSIVAEATRVMQPLLHKYQQQLTLTLPPEPLHVQADPRRTTQVLINLISNAGKYGPDNAAIDVSAAACEGSVRVTVADRGPGIPAAYRQDLFRQFVHPSGDNRDVQYGAGLGLSVVKAIVEAQGGQVGVDDRPGGGTIFWFTIPLEHNA
ncbi:MAG: PAS domain S-box protein [Anaerolineae bacterium]|nr:PAS domain S-box protein [Anaerolineae bacterium]